MTILSFRVPDPESAGPADAEESELREPEFDDVEDSYYRRIVVDSPLAALELGVADVLSGVDTLIARGMVDPDRMALVGFSNGGGAVAHVIARTDRFRCAVIQSPAGGGDWGSQFFDDPDGIYFQALLGDRTPWNAPALYAALSPVYHADRIRTPLLLAVAKSSTSAGFTARSSFTAHSADCGGP